MTPLSVMTSAAPAHGERHVLVPAQRVWLCENATSTAQGDATPTASRGGGGHAAKILRNERRSKKSYARGAYRPGSADPLEGADAPTKWVRAFAAFAASDLRSTPTTSTTAFLYAEDARAAVEDVGTDVRRSRLPRSSRPPTVSAPRRP